MPKPLGRLEHNPDRAVLSLFGLRCTDTGIPLVDGFGRVLRLAIERYEGDDADPTITQDDVTSIATATGANPLALQVIVLWEAPFLDGGQGGPDDDWTRGVSDGVVRYSSAETADEYLSQRAKELRQNPQSGWPSPEAQNEPSDTDSDVGVSPSSTGAAPSASTDEQGHDVFISHASESEDKEAVARPIAEALASAGWRVWLDEYELTVGDRLTESINAGLASSRFGVVVLSRAFFAKSWPKEELEGLAAKEAATGSKIILPVWHGIDQQYLADVAPTLAGRLGVSTMKGIPVVAQELLRALSRAQQAPVDAGSKPIVRSLTPSDRTREAVESEARRSSETPWVTLRESDSARTWLTRFIGMYEGMDAGRGDPVHAVRLKAKEFLDAGATDEHPPIIIKMIVEALPNDPRAATLEQTWGMGAASPAPALDAEEQRFERQRGDLSEVRKLLDDAAIALNHSDQIHRDIYDDLGNSDKVLTDTHNGDDGAILDGDGSLGTTERHNDISRNVRSLPSPDSQGDSAGVGAVKVASSLPLAALGDSPAVRRGLAAKSGEGRWGRGLRERGVGSR